MKKRTNISSKVNEINASRAMQALVVLVCLLAASALAQGTNSTANKADQNLKSSARVNPFTLAMEFTLPFGSYKGRNGSAIPIFLSYSSKVWEMEKINDRGETQYTPHQYYDYTRYHSIDVGAFFAERSASGWTSSLMPVTIVETFQMYDENGQIPDGFLSQEMASGAFYSGSNNLIDDEYCWWSDPEIVFDGGCMGLAYRSERRCCPPDQFCFEDGVSTECVFGGGGGWPGPEPDPGPTPLPTPIPPPPPPPPIPHAVHRVRLQMPDGSTHEFRKDDKVYNCIDFATECYGSSSFNGTYLSVDGSGMKFVRGETHPNNEIRDVLYLSDGGRYLFPNTNGQQPGLIANKAVKYIDKDGNVTLYDTPTMTWTDTMGRQIADSLRSVSSVVGLTAPAAIGTFSATLKGIDGQDLIYSLTWAALSDSFESPTTTIKKLGQDLCNSVLPAAVNAPSLFVNQPDDALFDQIEGRARYITKYRACAAPYGWGGDADFDPIILAAVTMPDGQKYTFKYNEYGEITKIVYPTGAYERFIYGIVDPVGFSSFEVFKQGNRGVTKRFVSEDGVTEQEWTHTETSTTAPDGSKVEKQMHLSAVSVWGFEDPLSGMPKEERTKDPTGVIRSRTINDWITASPLQGGSTYARRYPRLRRSVNITFEPNSSSALATLTEIDYDDSGSSDPEFFSHLNVKRKKSYHYVVIQDKTTVDDEALSWTTIESWFTADKLASITETDYSYDVDYKARGILTRPIETRVLNPSNPNDVLAKTQYVYDETAYFDNGYTTTNWEDPGSSLRGNVTTTRTWVKETNTWLETHAMYDNFGNVLKVWDASGDPAKYSETQYDPEYKYAFPTKVITPAPDPTNTHGSDQTSTVETTYDFSTGVPLSVKDDFGRITKTEYDIMLRPVRVFPDNFSAPESRTIYGEPDSNGQFSPTERFVTVRKQIDATKWDEATTWFDGLGRTTKTQAKDSQGDVFVETVYDEFGRVERVTNPYRVGDTVYWSKTRYDIAGRAVETYAPTALANLASAQSLGVTSFDISTVAGYVGTVVTTTDASLRKGRSITNALGQLIRVDEPTATGGTETSDLGPLGTPHQPTSYKYDVFGKMVEVTQGVQKRWFKYDALGRLLRVRQPEQEVNTALDLADSFNTSGQWTAGFTYDVLGNVLTATDANGVTITNTYDNAGRVKTRTYSDSTPPVNFYYDGKGLDQPQTPNYAKGKLTRVENTVSENRYRLFDNFGRLKEMEQRTPVGDETLINAPARVSKYGYNFSGALVEEEYPSGRVVKNEFEPDGDLLTVTSKKAGSGIYKPYVSNFLYTASGGISQMKLGNGRWETAKFNTRLQVTELGLGSSATDASIWKTAYEYGELQTNGTVDTAENTGNIARQTLTIPETSFVQSYKYDSLYRLTEAVEKAGIDVNWSQQFTYDRYGNRTAINQEIEQVFLNQTTSVDVNTNRFSPSQGFSYDKNGNVINDIDPATSLARQFIFNGDNKQTEVKRDGLTIGRYYYDGEGKRVRKETDTETTVFVYSAGKLIAEYSTQLSTQPATNYTTTDHLGTPRIITNELGQVKARRDFLPFGEELFVNVGERTENLKYGTNGDSVRQKFTGYQKDEETGLDFAEARMYENRLGRFTAVDPFLASGKSANPQTFNRFVYVGNRPTRIADPNGLDWWDVIDNSTGRRHIRWFDEDPDEEAYTINQRWTNYVYRATDGIWYGLDPNSGERYIAQDEGAAKSWVGLQVDFNGDYDGLVYETLGVKDMAYLTANMRTANVEDALYYFGKISVLNGVGAGLGRYMAGSACTLISLGPLDEVGGGITSEVTTALVPKAASSAGRWGETRLGQVLGGAVEKNTKPIATTLGNRVPDFLVDGIAHEAKAGLNVGLNSTIRKQILKDAELIGEKQVKGAHWHFFQGVQQEVLDFLTQNGIKYTVH